MQYRIRLRHDKFRIAAFNTHNSDTKAAAQACLCQALAVQLARRAGFGNGKAFHKLDKVDHFARYQMRDALAHVPFRKNHMVRTQTLHDAPVRLRVRLDPDIAHAQLVQVQRGKHAGLQIVTDGHHHVRKIQHVQLLEQIRVARVGLHHMRQFVCQALHTIGIDIYG